MKIFKSYINQLNIRQMNKSLVLIMIVVLTIVSCKKDDKKVNEQLQKVTVAQFGEVFLYLPLYLAEEKDFFKSEGLDVNIVSTGGDDKTFAAVIGGSAEFGIADPTFVAIANEKGQGGKVIASVVNGVPFWGVTKNMDIPIIDDIKEIEGYSVATFPSPSTAYTLQKDMFEDAGLEPNIKQGAFGTLLSMLESNQADIALELEPNVSTAVSQGAKVLYSFSDMYGDFAITGVTVSDNFIKEKPDLVQKFVNAIDKAEKWAHKYPDSAAYYANRKFPDLDNQIVNNATERLISTKTLPLNTIISKEAWSKAIDLRIEVGDINNKEKAMKVLDMTFAEKIKTPEHQF